MEKIEGQARQAIRHWTSLIHPTKLAIEPNYRSNR